MLKNKRFFTLLCICLFVLVMGGQAQAGRFFAGGGLGTLGYGGDIGYQWSNWLKFRLNVNHLSFSYDDLELEKIDYDTEFSNLTAGLLVDFHPFFGEFRISAGVYYRDLAFDIEAKPKKSIKIGHHTYNPSEFGRVDGEFTWDKFAPYLGVGWGLGSGTDMDFSIDINLGVMYLSGIDIDYKLTNYTGSLSDDEYRRDMDREAEKLKDKLEKYRFYPVLSVFLSFRF